MIRLIAPSLCRADEYYAMALEYSETDKLSYRRIDSSSRSREIIEFDLSLSNEPLPLGQVKTLVRWAENEYGEIVGSCRVRVQLNDRYRKRGGHIGYDVRSRYRRRGIGTQLLKEALGELRRAGLDRALLTCEDDNIASWKIIEKNGGKLDCIEYDEELKEKNRKYWIELS